MTEDEFQSLVRELAPQIACEARVAPTLRIGAIGHRDINPLVRAALGTAVSTILAQIRRITEAALSAPDLAMAWAGTPQLVVISPLAEGADRLVAEAGSALGYKLGAILPFEAGLYETTFDLADGKTAIAEFRGPLAQAALPNGFGVVTLDGDPAIARRDLAFLDCARAVTRWSDILIAILENDRWSSQTGLSVKEAIDAGIPVMVIAPSDPLTLKLWCFGTMVPVSANAPEIERIVTLLLKGQTGAARNSRSALAMAIYRSEKITCDFRSPSDFEYSGPFRTTTVAPFWVRWCKGLNRRLERLTYRLWVPGDPPNAPATHTVGLTDLPFTKASAAPIVTLFLHYHRADTVANEYGELHRSAQIVIAVLGLGTVFFAATGMMNRGGALIFTSLEFISLSLALGFIYIAHKQAWLDRWLGCRLLAEICRYSKFLILTGRSSPFGDLAPVIADLDSEYSWASNQAQRILRAQPLMIPGRTQSPDEDAIAAIRSYILSNCLDDQIRYHRKTAPLRRGFARRLRATSLWISAITIIVIATKFGLLAFTADTLMAPDTWLRKCFEEAGIILPAITAAILALRAFGEHEVVARRSTAMIGSLVAERDKFEHQTGLQAMGEDMLRISRLLLHEVDGWLEVFADKKLD